MIDSELNQYRLSGSRFISIASHFHSSRLGGDQANSSQGLVVASPNVTREAFVQNHVSKLNITGGSATSIFAGLALILIVVGIADRVLYFGIGPGVFVYAVPFVLAALVAGIVNHFTRSAAATWGLAAATFLGLVCAMFWLLSAAFAAG